MIHHNKESVKKVYDATFEQFGRDARALHWHNTDSQQLRYEVLTRRIDFQNKSVMDIGCGFGDFRIYLEAHGIHTQEYLGLEINDNFVNGAKEKLAGLSNVTIRQFDLKNIESLTDHYDVTVMVGVFHHCGVQAPEIYDLLYRTIDHLRLISNEVAIMLTSNQSTWPKNDSYVYLDPVIILSTVLSKYPESVLLDHSYFSKEFLLLVNA
ncbi:MAG TPA: class I SAM-dependent methyltransferase [Thiotrichaceae bacterium]|nr:class I SAM-dependent methyltransferase [Thiotrichaceae bacterium]